MSLSITLEHINCMNASLTKVSKVTLNSGKNSLRIQGFKKRFLPPKKLKFFSLRTTTAKRLLL